VVAARSFNASNEARTCLWCGRQLRRYRWRDGAPFLEMVEGRLTRVVHHNPRLDMQWGDYGDNSFCGQGCAYGFAVQAARNGYRLTGGKE